jgi:hypothetical protein
MKRWLRMLFGRETNVDPRTIEAANARKQAEQERDRVARQWPDVHHAARELDALGAAIEQALRGKR